MRAILSIHSLLSRCASLVVALCCLCFFSVPIFAEETTKVADTIVQQLMSARADLSYRVLGKAPVVGFYEVQVKNGPILYVSSDGKHFFDGSLYQVETGGFIDIKQQRFAEQRRVLFAERSTEDMIIFKPQGVTRAIINVFTDVDCGYCRKLHREVPQLNAKGVEVRYLAFPRAGIPSESYSKIATAWCAQDKQNTLTRIKNGDNVTIKVCEGNPVAEHYALGQRMGVSGTPAIVLMDGTLIPGYQPAEDFVRLLGLSDTDS